MAILDNRPLKCLAELLKPLILSKIKVPECEFPPQYSPFLYIFKLFELSLVMSKCCHSFKFQLVPEYVILAVAFFINILLLPLNSIFSELLAL